MTRVIHTGDTHIGYSQYHSPVRRQDFLDAFEAVVDDAVDGGVDAVVHAGDLFHDRRPDLQDLMGTISVLRRLDDAGIPFLAVVGNHESTRGGQWLDLFERLGLATRLGDEPVVVGDTAFYGLDHVPVSRRDDLDYAFADHDADYAALVAHGLFEPFGYADWDTETVLTESDVAFDAMLLGDNHTPDTAEVADTWVTYPGSTERASASEREGRGYNLVVFDADTAGGDDRVEIRRRALDTRPFVFVSVELREGEGESRVRERVREFDLAEAVVHVEITGEGDPVTPAAVEEFATDEGALIARVVDRREVDADGEVDVSFADPEDAVRDRLDEMALSTAARDVERTVREDTVSDANVRETVKRRVEERVDGDGDLDAFDAVEAGGDGAESDADGDEWDGGGAEPNGDASEPTEPNTEPEAAEPEDSDPASTDGQVSMEDYL
ncbi:DNA double-strand break repair protein Mre11 [Halorubrum ezzemoulense]|uniref:DNA double-strand break repair protein Mre11 n=1 Tax=Halorubrum ezzemoulense TaxID=337243 RepID=A0ABT4Z5S6_HALEZ|nr:DNA double-strand break repair protein Mre11 [Halorubrum ezzemoulense]MDB2245887.1 DNA double-strand break repair protein Mre11 [Halorubrum ezzemoulense]MDB2252847.1 DNA double-strand break repair protein Mre11 [Halorubrum ezzemoulense]MDB2279535.1 DNA double-strand break repair protein Mre11 [Halorubrum ezzemoulense]MDB2286869.1 DNA double-strand break repair protein Mre11 [Halorubrum ezzemoulense]MDB2289696.1 DNA double-strand break repair protein Mre11 [Halorubrum ezzemoulense]